MQRTHRHLHRLLNPPGSGAPLYHWHQVLGMVTEVCKARSPAAEAELRRVATFKGKLRLNPSHGLPHSMPPEDLLRLLAIQQLAHWDRHRHRGVIRQVAELAETESVRRLARVLGR